MGTALRRCTKLSSLMVANCALSGNVAAALFTPLIGLPSLSAMCVCNNNVAKEGAVALAAVMQSCPLSHIDISDCQLNAASVAPICSAAKEGQARSLILARNRIGEEGTGHVESVLQNGNLRELSVSNTALAASFTVALAAALAKSSCSLTKVWMNGIDFGHSEAEALAAALAGNVTLKRLELNRLNSGTAVHQPIIAALKRNLTCDVFGLAGVGKDGWAEQRQRLRAFEESDFGRIAPDDVINLIWKEMGSHPFLMPRRLKPE
mmetsp:Transcript_50592/g.130437  ORF Transcript_50592/g.130437 Transcript_50592/m.130437 type:complete len:264 (-) Transcript_50592:956-1747(-)